MSSTRRHLQVEEKRNVDKMTNDLNDKWSFSIFNDGTGTVNLGLGTDVESNLVFSSESDGESAPLPPPDLPNQPTGTNKPALNIFSISTVNEEPTDIDSDDIVKKSAKMFEDTKEHLRKFKSISDKNDLDPDELLKPNPSLEIIDNEEVKDITVPILDVEDEDITPVESEEQAGGLIIINKKNSSSDKPKKEDHWFANTFIVAPVKGIFRALYNGVINIFGFFGKMLVWGLVGMVLTVGIYVIMAHYSDTGQSALEMAVQHYEALKEILVTFWKDVRSEI